MDLKILKLSEVSQTRKTNIMSYHFHVELKKGTIELAYKTVTDVENKHDYQEVRGKG